MNAGGKVMMKKRTICLILVVSMMMTLPINAAEIDQPSEWAIEELVGAMEQGLVPEVLVNKYSVAIKRYEYVLLALEILEEKGIDIVVSKKYPFDDISGHRYADEIVQAYNIGLIGGYGDRTFKADNEISREEIAKLVVNLYGIINENNASTQEIFDYSDLNSIASWAKSSVDFCYSKEIIKGIGLDGNLRAIISPKGTATVEQSIVMLYRVASDEALFNGGDYGQIDIVKTIDDTQVRLPSFLLNDFYDTYGKSITDTVKDIQENTQFNVTQLNKSSVTLENDTNTVISLNNNGGSLNVYMNLAETEDVLAVTYYKSLLEAVDATGKATTTFTKALNEFEDGTMDGMLVTIDEEQVFESFIESGNDDYYIFKYKKGL